MRIAEIFRSIQGEGRLTGTESIFVRTSGCHLRCGYCDTPYTSWTPEGNDLSVAEILARIDELRQAKPALAGQKTDAASTKRPPTAAAGGSATLAPPPDAAGGRFTGVDCLTVGKPHHVVLTGGEPMLLAELIPLSVTLHVAGWHITIETSGTLYLPVACDLMSISPKLSNSTPSPEQDPQWAQRHTLKRHAPDVLRRLTAEYDYQLKFVIDRPEDCREVETYLGEFPEIPRGRVMLMPQGIDAAALAEKAVWLEPYCTTHGFQFCPRRQIEWFGMARGT